MDPSGSSSSGQQAAASERSSAGESMRIFVAHVKQYFATLPLVTVGTFAIAFAVMMCDGLGIFLQSPRLLSQWLRLDGESIVYGQGQRLILYPFAFPGFSLFLTNLFLLLPYLAAQERKHGSIKLAWVLLTFFTVITGILCTLGVALLSLTAESRHVQQFVYAGLSGWTVGLAFWSAWEEDQPADRMLFGVLRVPGRMVPYLILAFYTFLVPDASLLLHLFAILSALLYTSKRGPNFLFPSQDTLSWYQDHPWLSKARNSQRFVTLDAASNSSYLTLPTNSSSNTPRFPGQGRRLGDA